MRNKIFPQVASSFTNLSLTKGGQSESCVVRWNCVFFLLPVLFLIRIWAGEERNIKIPQCVLWREACVQSWPSSIPNGLGSSQEVFRVRGLCSSCLYFTRRIQSAGLLQIHRELGNSECQKKLVFTKRHHWGTRFEIRQLLFLNGYLYFYKVAVIHF